MKIDEKTLSILGAPKEGFQWVEIEWPNVDRGDLITGDRVIASGYAWAAAQSDAELVRGIAIGTGKFYRQCPVEVEPEVIWGPHMNNFAEYRILVDGTLEVNHGDKWQGVEKTGHAGVKIADDYATQHAELKAAREKLREIKAKADVSLSTVAHGVLRRNGWNDTADLVELCRALEVE